MKKAIIFDLDGTLANIDKRREYLNNNPKDWNGFFTGIADDLPNSPVVMLYKLLESQNEYTMIIVSGRPDKYKVESIDWLEKHGIHYKFLYMRKSGDRRPDYLIKEEVLDEIILKGFEVFLSVDDRNSVVQMWRKRGITCFQCAYGDF
ncbi:HAD family acid phosphatase [Rahnella contaminans]|uniref:phosphatase domain-containing protein n=1 Tax=Rahnella contaminans TaxID=2703882 RepID=UPI003C2E761A